jgi:hypothetical protein
MRSRRKKFRAQGFKTLEKQSRARAWCTVCSWGTSQGATGETKLVCKSAKEHTEKFGHETRIDISRQRGYRLHPTQAPECQPT